MEVKYRTVIVFEKDIDLYGENPINLARAVEEQLLKGDIYFDEYLDTVEGLTVSVLPIDSEGEQVINNGTS